MQTIACRTGKLFTHKLLGALGSIAVVMWLSSGLTAQPRPAWAAWQDLLNHLPDVASLNRTRIANSLPNQTMIVQKIEDAGGRHVNFDEYVIDVAKLPTSAGLTTTDQLIEHIRANLGAFLDPAFSRFRALEGKHEEDRAWQEFSRSLGTVREFLIPLSVWGIPGAAVEEAAVVTSQLSKSSWTFSPVTVGVLSPGEHPVSGNRQFGIRRTPSGAHQVFTRAADRHVGRIMDVVGSRLTTGEASETLTFEGADKLWRSFQTRTVEFIRANGGQASVGAVITHRPTWDSVKQSGLFTRR